MAFAGLRCQRVLLYNNSPTGVGFGRAGPGWARIWLCYGLGVGFGCAGRAGLGLGMGFGVVGALGWVGQGCCECYWI